MNLIERFEPAVAVGFDYSTVPVDVAKEARAVAARINERNRAAQAAILETGRDLLAIKERLEHGRFLAWIDAEFGMTPRTAQRYMSAAAVLGDKSDIVSFLPPTTIYQLAAPSMPPPVREEIVERIENERLAPATVEKIVREAKDETRRQRALAKMSAAERKAAE